MGTPITPKFNPNDTIWFVDLTTSHAASAPVINISSKVSNALVTTITYFVSLNGIDRYVDDSVAFESQADLAASFLAP